eukprot:COSAG03_NODE_3726_length_1857_cov_428.260523_1_plen_64_part_00
MDRAGLDLTNFWFPMPFFEFFKVRVPFAFPNGSVCVCIHAFHCHPIALLWFAFQVLGMLNRTK